jgi:hypothetical protein
MTDRRPLVIVNGLQQELPAGDNLSDPVLAALSQISGLSGTLAEVEANTKAGRVTLRYADQGPMSEQSYDVSRHAFGRDSSFSATTTWVASDMFFFAWFGNGIFVLRKLWVTLSTSAVTGTRAGGAQLLFREIKPLLGAPGSNLWCIPPQATIGNNLNVGTPSVQNFHSLRQRQSPPATIMALPTSNTNPTGSMAWTGSIINVGNSSNQIQFGVKSQIGIDLPPTMLVDTSAGQAPFIYEPSQGGALTLTYPVAVTSQVVNFTVNAVWDEWVPVPNVVL